ncbi:hypothetical protein NCAS_0B06200 [Naumovozyma castellii]|uniref:Uncharacterized protein n=1 Tax=Naumovozyma castellii TaxID=27288 RepID=G0V9T7_NAUCA|nr:hypothetical protein NCAS_0B06200 [Naumovozyma castellii CBS 4309]CCC68704.1 hypothetical protein NCAS_0B06200 [Naumovozyma castellii CBS 4309]
MSDKPIDTVDELASKTKPIAVNYWAQINDYTKTPYPAIINSALIFATPVLSPPIKAGIVASGSFLRSQKTSSVVGLTNKNVLLFGAAQALGAKMLSDGDIHNGSGFVAAWSTLFLIVNGKKSFKSLASARTWPLFLTIASLGNAIIYGRRFIASGFK